jgi:outer membrane protein OmpU
MKKVLLATSALVAFAGAASAEITFSGYARFGAQYTEGSAAVAAVAGKLDTYILGVATAVAGTVTANDVAAARAAVYVAADGLGTAVTDAARTTAAEILADAELELAARLGTAAVDAGANATTIDQRFNIDVAGSMESEGGLTFGAMVRMRAEEAGDAATAMTINGARYSVSTGGMTLAVGNIYGAMDAAPGLFGGSVGLTGLGWGNVVTNFATHDYSDRGVGINGVELIYSAGDLGVHFSTVKNGDTEAMVSYSAGGLTVAAGGSNTDVAANAKWVATLGTSVGGVGVGLNAARTVAGNNSMTAYASLDAGAATKVTVYAASDAGQTDKNAYGLGVVHNLGGGASIRGGVANTHGTNRADLGVQFNF